MIITTTNDLPGSRIFKVHEVARGITVHSRSVIGNPGGAIQSNFGGNLSVCTNLAETARQAAYDLMAPQAGSLGGNAMRYDANEIMDGTTEVLAYGTAVTVEGG